MQGKTARKLLPQVAQDLARPLHMRFPSHGRFFPHASGRPIFSLLLDLRSHYHLSEASLTTPFENVTPPPAPQHFLSSFSVLFLFSYYLSPSNKTYLLLIYYVYGILPPTRRQASQGSRFFFSAVSTVSREAVGIKKMLSKS